MPANSNTPDGFAHGGNFYAENAPLKFSIDVGDDVGDIIRVTVTAKQGDNDVLDAVSGFKAYLSNSAIGSGLAATGATGGLAFATTGTVDEIIAGKMIYCTTNQNTGIVDIDVTNVGGATFYFCILDPLGRVVVASKPLTFTA